VGRGGLRSRKNEFYTRNGVLVNSERYFLSVPSPKMLNFPPEVVSWWTLKMCVCKLMNTLLYQRHGVGKLFTAL